MDNQLAIMDNFITDGFCSILNGDTCIPKTYAELVFSFWGIVASIHEIYTYIRYILSNILLLGCSCS